MFDLLKEMEAIMSRSFEITQLLSEGRIFLLWLELSLLCKNCQAYRIKRSANISLNNLVIICHMNFLCIIILYSTFLQNKENYEI